jgi:hypothetical protein
MNLNKLILIGTFFDVKHLTLCPNTLTILLALKKQSMKTKTIALILTLIFFSIGCEKTTLENMDVKTYVKLLKSGEFDFNNSNGLPDLPPFKSTDIPELLKYADDNQIITKYPHNPISSLIGEDPRLGVLVLWTVESIRLSPNGPSGRFPSLIPGFWNKKLQEPADVNIVHSLASQAYKTWWISNPDFEHLKLINPIENTDYGWR